MSYDDKTGKMDWKDESIWMLISLVSGIALSIVFIHFNRFQNVETTAVFLLCIIGFYVLSILLRIQNHRGKILTAKTAINEKYIKYIFPIIGFGLGLALLLF
jgi:uncharacterized membrane protein YfcA